MELVSKGRFGKREAGPPICLESSRKHDRQNKGSPKDVHVTIRVTCKYGYLYGKGKLRFQWN